MSIQKVWVDEGCIACNLCVELCPDVFELPDDIAIVKEGVNFDDHDSCIRESAAECPVEVIHFVET